MRIAFILILISVSIPIRSAHAAQRQVAGPEHHRLEAGGSAGFQALPPEARSLQSIELEGHRLEYTAAVGALPVRDENGRTLAEVVYTAYTAHVAGRGPRPVTFVFPGGPGASSAEMDLGGIGPKFINIGVSGSYPSEPPALKDNPGTWLGFTDLVFIDPVGTGFSRSWLSEKQDVERFYSNEADFHYLARTVYQWLVLNKRLGSRKYLVGESFGGYRVPRMLRYLQTMVGVAASGVVLISPELDRAEELYAPISPLPWIITLPSMAAARFESMGELDAARMQPVIDYAQGQYLLDLMKGRSDPRALDRIVANVAKYTGLSQELVRKLGGRIPTDVFIREIHRTEGELGSVLDSNFTSYDPFPHAPEQRTGDPIIDTDAGPLVSGIVNFYTNTLGWQVDRPYYFLNERVNAIWNGNDDFQAESVTDLRRAMATDPSLRVLIAHGWDDLSCPFLASVLLVDQMPIMSGARQIQVREYPGGHMFYNRLASRLPFQSDVRALYDGR